jgi:hypothetical protein
VQAILNLSVRMGSNKSASPVGPAGGFNLVMTIYILAIGDFKCPGTVGFVAEFCHRYKWCE